MTLQETYERSDAGRELKVQKERIKAHVTQIKLCLTTIRAIKSKYIDASVEVDAIDNELKSLISAIE